MDGHPLILLKHGQPSRKKAPLYGKVAQIYFARSGSLLLCAQQYALGVPASTPDAVVRTLSEAARYAIKETDIKAMLESYSMEVRGTGAEEAQAIIASERQRWAKAAKEANISAN